MAFQVSLSDAATGTPHPLAYVRIDDAQVQLANSSVILTLNTYHDATAAQTALAPVLKPEQFTLSQAELVALRTAFRAFLYALPRLRALYPGALDV